MACRKCISNICFAESKRGEGHVNEVNSSDDDIGEATGDEDKI